MNNKEKVKPKYNDADTKKQGSSIETPYKHGDLRNKLRNLPKVEDKAVIKTDDE